MSKKREIGLIIVMAPEACSDSYIEAKRLKKTAPGTKKFCCTSVEDAILNCVATRCEIKVAATATSEAIEKILYSVNALDKGTRQFFLRRIGTVLVGVRNECMDVKYGFSKEIRALIEEDKLYRIFGREKELFLKKRDDEGEIIDHDGR